MDVKKFLDELGIDTSEAEYDDNGNVVINLGTSNQGEKEWSKVQILLEDSDELEEDEESSVITYDSSSIQYFNDDCIITLLGNFNTDEYKLTAKER